MSDRWFVDFTGLSWHLAWLTMNGGATFDFVDNLVDKGALLCLDAKTNVRKQVYPWYKGERAGWEKKYGKEELRALAKSWCEQACKRYPFDWIVVEGLEADDLLASMSKAGDHLVTVDKDALQLEGRRFLNWNLEEWTLEKMQAKHPNLQLDTPERWLVYQLLYGDTTDSIPRALHTKDRKSGPSVLKSDCPLLYAIELLGEQIAIERLNVLLTPTPLLSDGSCGDTLGLAKERYGYEAATQGSH